MGGPYKYIDGVKMEMDPEKGRIALVKGSMMMVPIKFVVNTFVVEWIAYPIGVGLVKISTKGYAPVKIYACFREDIASVRVGSEL